MVLCEGKVSIWMGTLDNEAALHKITTSDYNEEGDLTPSDFMRAFGINFLDHDFQEVFFSHNMACDVKELSYADSFINELADMDLRSFNTAVVLYDFAYNGKVSQALGLKFIGVCNYEKI